MDSRAVLLQRKRDANNGKNCVLRHTYKMNRRVSSQWEDVVSLYRRCSGVQCGVPSMDLKSPFHTHVRHFIRRPTS